MGLASRESSGHQPIREAKLYVIGTLRYVKLAQRLKDLLLQVRCRPLCHSATVHGPRSTVHCSAVPVPGSHAGQPTSTLLLYYDTTNTDTTVTIVHIIRVVRGTGLFLVGYVVGRLGEWKSSLRLPSWLNHGLANEDDNK